MSDMYVSQIIGFLVGIFSSWFFWRTLLFVKPKIEIAPLLVYDPHRKQLLVKIRNRGRHWVTDVQAKFMLSERKRLSDGKYRTSALHYYEFRRDNLFALAPKQWHVKPWCSYYSYYTFVAYEDGNPFELASSPDYQERRFEFQLISSDALTNTKGVQSATYSLEDIRVGKYDREFKIIEIDIKSQESIDDD